MTFAPHHRGRRHTAFTVTRRRRLVAAALVVLGGALVDAATSSANEVPRSAPAIAHVPRGVETPARVCQRATTTRCFAWSTRDTWAGHGPVIALLNFHPLGQAPGVVATAGWIRSAATDLGLYLGYEGPGATSLPRGPEEVPAAGLPRLLATFNSGFYEQDAAAGFYTNHTLYFPLVKGLATVVRYTNGTVGITSWQGARRPVPPSRWLARTCPSWWTSRSRRR